MNRKIKRCDLLIIYSQKTVNLVYNGSIVLMKPVELSSYFFLEEGIWGYGLITQKFGGSGNWRISSVYFSLRLRLKLPR